jgi:HlyD family secretion protein
MTLNLDWKRKINPLYAGASVIALLGLGATYLALSQTQPFTPTPEPQPVVTPVTTVTALGRIEPQGEVIKLSVSNAQDSRVDQLLVAEGDQVKAGQVIAILQGLDKKQAALAEAQQNLAIQQAKLAQIQAGEAKLAEIAAQQAQIAQLQAQLRTETLEREGAIAQAQSELNHAQTNYQRYRSLNQEGAVSTASLDDQRQLYETAQAQVNIALAQKANTLQTLQEQIHREQAVLAQLKEVRPVDLQVAKVQVNYGQTQIQKAKADLNDLYVKVPISGQILKINTKIGEQVNTSQGIVELGQTNQMYAIAEVYETDVKNVKVGQEATIISENGGLDNELKGVVEHIGLQIKKQDVLDSDPAAAKDARVVEVKVKIDPEDSSLAAGLTNMQVRVKIDLE